MPVLTTSENMDYVQSLYQMILTPQVGNTHSALASCPRLKEVSNTVGFTAGHNIDFPVLT